MEEGQGTEQVERSKAEAKQAALRSGPDRHDDQPEAKRARLDLESGSGKREDELKQMDARRGQTVESQDVETEPKDLATQGESGQIGSSACGLTIGGNARVDRVTVYGPIGVDAGGSSVQQNIGSGATPKSIGDMSDQPEANGAKQDFESRSGDREGNYVAGDVTSTSTEIRTTQMVTNSVHLSQDIQFFPDKKMSDHAFVFEGEQISGVFGILPIAVKLVDHVETGITEATILRKLNENPHSYIISLIHSDWYSDGFCDYVYIALEKCHSDTIRQFLLDRKDQEIPFDLDLMLKFCKQLTCGIEYIHGNNIIHKDLKPDNVFLSLDQSKVKIADFGMSQEIESKSSKVYNSGYFGTSGYRAPETFGGAAISQKTDIYSLGIIVYFLLSNGEHPFGSDPVYFDFMAKQNTGIDLSQLLVPNIKTTQHLIKCSIKHDLDSRPTIWEVEAHPCWEGKEVECNFGYRSETCQTEKCAPSEVKDKLTRSVCEQYFIFLKEIKRLGLDTEPRKEDQKPGTIHFEQPDEASTTDQDSHLIATEDKKSDSGPSASGFIFGDHTNLTIQDTSLEVVAEGSSVQQHTGSGAIPKSKGDRPGSAVSLFSSVEREPDISLTIPDSRRRTIRANVGGSSASAFSFGDHAQVTVDDASIGVAAGEGSSVQLHTGSGAVPKSRGDRPDRVQLTGSICYFPKKRIAKRVFHGEQTTLTGESRRIAVKTGFWDKNILRESKMLLKLGAHQNVVTYIDTGSYNYGETMFLAMELCHEQNLKQYTEAQKEIGEPFDKTLAIEHAKQIVAGLVHIHDHGIIHRDLKPDNILFSRDQKYLKISDFDLSKEIGTQSTSFGQAGSEGYRAPEVINKGPISKKADIFSLGLVLHYIWSYGEHPFGSDPTNWNYHISNNLNPDFSSLQLVPNARATNLIGWMLHSKPKLRPSIQEVGEDLSGSKKAPRYLPTGLREITIMKGRAVGSRYPAFLTEVGISLADNIGTLEIVKSDMKT